MPRQSLRLMRLSRSGQSGNELSNGDIDNTQGRRRSERLTPRLIRDTSDVQPLEYVSDKVVVYRNGERIEEPRVWISHTARAHWAEGHGHRYGFVYTNKSRLRFANAPSLPLLEHSTHSVELKMSSFVDSELGAAVFSPFHNVSNYTSQAYLQETPFLLDSSWSHTLDTTSNGRTGICAIVGTIAGRSLILTRRRSFCAHASIAT